MQRISALRRRVLSRDPCALFWRDATGGAISKRMKTAHRVRRVAYGKIDVSERKQEVQV